MSLRHLLLLLFSVITTAGIAQPPCSFPGSDSRWDTRFAEPGITSASVQIIFESSDGRLLIGLSTTGSFGGDNYLGSLAWYNGQSYEAFGGKLYGASLTVNAIAEDAAGNLYIGGVFSGGTNPNGVQVPSANVIRWNTGTNSWEALGAGLNGPVESLALDQDTLYAGGAFTATAGPAALTVNHVAAFETGSGLWRSLGQGVGQTGSSLTGNVESIHLTAAGELIVGGSINRAGTLPINSIARWTPGTGWDDMAGGLPSFQIDANGVPTGVQSASTVYAVEVHPVTGRIFASGNFGEYIASASITQRRGLAEWNGTSWALLSGIGIPINFFAFQVYALMADTQTNQLFVGGAFHTYTALNPANSSAGNGIMALNLTTGVWNNLDGGILQGAAAGGTVRSIARYGNRIFAGGSFAKRTPDGDFANNLLAYDGSTWDNLGDGLNGAGEVYALDQWNGQIIAAGTFQTIDHLTVPRIGIWDAASGWDTLTTKIFGNFGSNFATNVYSLKVHGNDLYVGGQFGGIGTVTSAGLLRYNLLSQTWTSWGSGIGGIAFARVNDFEIFQGQVYVAGYFTTIDGVAATHVARLTPTGWEGIGTLNNRVYSLANAGDSMLYIGGDFTQVNGDGTMNKVAGFDGTNWYPLGQGIQNGQVADIAVDPVTGFPWVGGSITGCRQASGTVIAVNRLAVWDGTAWSQAGTFTSDPQFGNIQSMLFDSTGILYLGGGFVGAGGVTVNRIMRWHPTFGVAGFGAGLDSNSPTATTPVRCMLLADSSLYLGGSFYRTGSAQAAGFGRYTLDDPFAGQISIDLGTDTTACQTLTLMAGNAATYLWNTGATTSAIVVDSTGWYAVEVSEGSCTASDSIFVTIIPAAEVFASDSLQGCDAVLVDAGPGFLSYQWNTGDTTQTTLVNDNDWIRVSVSDDFGCETTDSVFVEITGYSPTASFFFTISGDSLIQFDATSSSMGTSFQWDFGDGSTATGDISSHQYASNDTFTIRLIVGNDCGFDTAFNVIVVDFLTALDGIPASLTDWNLMPNPTQGKVLVQGYSQRHEMVTCRILTTHGQEVIREDAYATPGAPVSFTFQTDGLPAGLYLVEIRNGQGSVTQKLIRQ